MKYSSLRPPWSRRAGFTLVEIMIVVLIIGMIAAIAIPAIQRVQLRAKKSRFVSDLRVFTQAFETYAMQNGGWPPNVGPGIVPPALSGALQVNVWTNPSVVGGNWNYDNNINGVTTAISISGANIDTSVMQAIDAIIDDGDLSTGNFQLINSRYMYILEP